VNFESKLNKRFSIRDFKGSEKFVPCVPHDCQQAGLSKYREHCQFE